MKQRIRLVAVGAIAALATFTGVAAALADTGTQQVTTEAPPPIVEDYSYPGAEQIEADTGVELLKGDGNIIKVSCDKQTPVIQVESSDDAIDVSCYEVIDSHGWLTMRIPDVYTISGDDHHVDAQVTSNGQTKSLEIAPGEHRAVGIGNGPGHDPATLVELRVS